jgi:uncharacterized protein YydD (DUF2326 family)
VGSWVSGWLFSYPDCASVPVFFNLPRLNVELPVLLPDSLIHDYQELVEFNRRLSSDRSQRLRKLRKKLYNQREETESRIDILDQERQTALATLQEMKTFEKYKDLQEYLYQYERQIHELEEQLTFLDRAADVQRSIEEHERKRDEIITQIKGMVRKGNSTYTAIRRKFAEYVESVLNLPAVLSVTVNQSGNLEFYTKTIDQKVSERETSEASGTSYKKILCACFDLALLSVYASDRFYHFAYHDGIFEGLDNRKKVSLLELIRRVCDEKGIQHILTVIDSDLPRDERDQKLLFSKQEIIRELHDGGDEGRLFKMAAF